MEHEKFKNIAQGVQSIVVILALAIGGLWAAYRYDRLEDTVSLDLSIEAYQIASPATGLPTIFIDVSAKNNGSRNVEFDLTENPVIVQRLIMNHPNPPVAARTWELVLGAQFKDKSHANQSSTSQGLQPGSTKILRFMQEVDEPGIYFVVFRAPVAARLHREVDDPYFDEGAWISWMTSTYLSVVEPNQLAKTAGED